MMVADWAMPVPEAAARMFSTETPALASSSIADALSEAEKAVSLPSWSALARRASNCSPTAPVTAWTADIRCSNPSASRLANPSTPRTEAPSPVSTRPAVPIELKAPPTLREKPVRVPCSWRTLRSDWATSIKISPRALPRSAPIPPALTTRSGWRCGPRAVPSPEDGSDDRYHSQPCESTPGSGPRR
jgi:hypothetical protein